MTRVQTTPHVHIDAQGRAWIDDTNIKVVEVVKDWLAHGSSPEEMCLQFPHLTLAQVYSALAYYYDHKEELDSLIAQELANWDRQMSLLHDSPIRQKLRALGKIR